MTAGTIIIAAHNEELVIGRTLEALADVRTAGDIAVVVVPNGCSDHTADVARGYPGVVVRELDAASKTAALRVGDAQAGPGPRIYLDADVVLTSRAARDVVRALTQGSIAGRPPHVFDTSRATWVVRSWYRVRQALPSISGALWGAGCYALSQAGRGRFDEFPDIVSDDLFIDSLFAPAEVTIVETDPVVVTAPRRTADLVRILRRSYRTQSEVEAKLPGLSRGQRGQLADIKAMLAHDPRLIGDIVVYIAIVAYARVRTRFARGNVRWERDVSSRESG